MNDFTVKAIATKMPKFIEIISIHKAKDRANYFTYNIKYKNNNTSQTIEKSWSFKAGINEVTTLSNKLKKSFEYKELEILKSKLSKKNKKRK